MDSKTELSFDEFVSLYFYFESKPSKRKFYKDKISRLNSFMEEEDPSLYTKRSAKSLIEEKAKYEDLSFHLSELLNN